MSGVDGDGVTLECEFSDGKDLEVEWVKDGKPIKPNKDMLLSWNPPVAKLEILELLYPDDSGLYTCRAKSPSGVVDTSATLSVKGSQWFHSTDSGCSNHVALVGCNE